MVDIDKRANNSDADLPAGFKMTELGPLPEEWKVVKLGEIGEVTAGGSAPQERYYFNGRHPFVRVQHLDEDGYWVRRWDLITDEAVQAYRLRFFPKGTIVLPKSGASIRLEKRAVLPVDAYIVSHLCAVIPNSKAVDQRYLFYALKVRKFSSEKVEGYPTLNLSEIRNALIPLPPLSEQRAIAHVLRTVQRAKEATERVIQATRELKKSLMHYLFTYGPVPVEEAERVPLKETEIGLVPEEWKVVRLGEVVKKARSGGTPLRSKKEYWNGSIPFALIEDLTASGLYLYRTKESISEEGLRNSSAWIVPEGSILLSMYATIGATAVNKIPLATNQAILALVPTENLNAEFGALLLSYKADELARFNVQSTQKNINKGIVLRFFIPLPPLSEQRAIARVLRTVNKKLQAEEARKQALKELFKTLLHNLMTGKIRAKDVVLPNVGEGKGDVTN